MYATDIRQHHRLMPPRRGHNKKLSYCWQTAWCVWRSVKVTKHGTIRYVRYGFLLVCYSKFVLKTCLFQIFDFKKMLWPWNLGQRSLKVIEDGTNRYTGYGFLLVFYSNFVHLRYSTSKMPWPWKPIRGLLRSFEMSPFDRAYMTSKWCSIATMALSRVVSWIFNVKKHCDLEIWVRGHSWSWKMIPFDRLLMTSYRRSIVTMAPSGVISEINGDFSRNLQTFPTPVYFAPHWRGSSWNWVPVLAGGGAKTRMMWLTGWERSLTISSAMWIQCTNVTDGQQRPCLCIASRGKNWGWWQDLPRIQRGWIIFNNG